MWIQAHLALAALMARGLSIDLPPCPASRRNLKKVSIYLSLEKGRAVDGGYAISAISAGSSREGGGRGSRSAFLGPSRVRRCYTSPACARVLRFLFPEASQARARVMRFGVSARIAQAHARVRVRGTAWLAA